MIDSVLLLDAWDDAEALPVLLRGAHLTHRLGLLPDGVRAPLAECAAALIAVHSELLGPVLSVVVTCAACDAELSTDLDLSALPTGSAMSTVALSIGPVDVRPLRPVDLLAAARAADPRDRLLAAMIDSPGRLTDADLAAVDETAETQAGAAGVVLAMTCPECGAIERAGVDVADLVRRRVGQWAEDRLTEVDALARAYGWTEEQVLGLAPTRRARYLELVS